MTVADRLAGNRLKWFWVCCFEHLLLSQALVSLGLHEQVVWLWKPLEFAEIPATSLKFDVSSFFFLRVQILIYFADRHERHVAWQQMLRQVSQRVEVANPEAPFNPVFFAVRELVKNGRKVWHHKVRSELGLLHRSVVCIVGKQIFLVC